MVLFIRLTYGDSLAKQYPLICGVCLGNQMIDLVLMIILLKVHKDVCECEV